MNTEKGEKKIQIINSKETHVHRKHQQNFQKCKQMDIVIRTGLSQYNQAHD